MQFSKTEETIILHGKLINNCVKLLTLLKNIYLSNHKMVFAKNT